MLSSDHYRPVSSLYRLCFTVRNMLGSLSTPTHCKMFRWVEFYDYVCEKYNIQHHIKYLQMSLFRVGLKI